MNKVPPDQDPLDDVDAQYRRASALDPSRPGEAVRRTVLAHAAQLAAERAAAGSSSKLRSRRMANQAWWRPAIFGTLAAAGLAALVIAPQFLAPRAPPVAESSPAARANGRADQAAPSAPAIPSEITAEPPASVRNAPPLRPARARPKSNDAAVAAAPEPTPLAPPAGSEAAAAGAVVGGLLAGEQRVPGSRPAAGSIAAAARFATDPAAALRRAAEIGDLPTLAALVEKQADIDSRDSAGRTALMLATLHGQASAVAALLVHGADPNAAAADGTTPLQAATACDQPAIAAALRRYGAR